MKPKIIFKGIFEYISALALAVIFALFLSGRVGWFLVLVFTAVPITSLCLTLPLLKGIEITGSLSSSLVNKREFTFFELTVENKTYFSAPQIIIDMAENPKISYDIRRFYVSVMPLSRESFSARVACEVCGKATAGVCSVKIRDYLGIFSFNIKNINLEELRAPISIIPNIADIPQDFWLLNAVREASAEADDSEDTVESGLNGFGGFPGYESREYVPGDPLKRINWKLSAKKNKLLIRLDDQIEGLFASVVLDSVCQPSDTEINTLLMGQAAIENALGVVKRLTESNYTVSFYYITEQKGDSLWVSRPVKEKGDLDSLRTALGDYSYLTQGEAERFPLDEIAAEKGSVAVFSTPFADRTFKAYLTQESKKSGINILLYSQSGKEEE